jgi:hypothetical protein
MVDMKSKELQQVLGKFLKSEAAGNARVQVVLPNGEYYDITGMQLLENKLIGVTKKPLGPCSVKLYPGSMVLELADRKPCSPIAESWPEVQKIFDSLSM